MLDENQKTSADSPSWWEQALAGLPPAIRPGCAEWGYYRQVGRRADTGEVRSRAIAIWFDDRNGVLTARIDDGDDMSGEADVWRAFLQGHEHPISYETYAAVANGAPWPDEIVVPPAAGVRPAHEECTMQVRCMRDQFERWWTETAGEKIRDQEDADLAASYAERFLTLEKTYKEVYDETKRPHLAACQTVDNQWRAPIRMAAEMKDRAKQVQGPFLAAKQARFDADLCEQRRLQDEARAAVAAGEQPALPELRPETRAKTGAGVGKRSSLREIPTYVVTDIQAAAKFISERNRVPRVFVDAVLAVAKLLDGGGVRVPGIKYDTKQKVV